MCAARCRGGTRLDGTRVRPHSLSESSLSLSGDWWTTNERQGGNPRIRDSHETRSNPCGSMPARVGALQRRRGDESRVGLERSTLIRCVVAANHLDALVAEKLLQVKDRRSNVDGACREGVAQLVSVDVDAAALAEALHELLHARDGERQGPRSNLLGDAEEDLARWAGPLWVSLGGDVPLEPPRKTARLRGATTVRGEQRHGSVTAVLGEVGAVGGPLHHHEWRSIPYVEVIDAERHELAHTYAGREQGLDDEPVAGTLAGVKHAPDVQRTERLRPLVLRLAGPRDAFDAGEPDRLVAGCARAEPGQRAEVGPVLGHRRSTEHAGEISEEPLEAFDREVLKVADADLVPPEREPARRIDQVVPAVAKRCRRPVEGVTLEHGLDGLRDGGPLPGQQRRSVGASAALSARSVTTRRGRTHIRRHSSGTGGWLRVTVFFQDRGHGTESPLPFAQKGNGRPGETACIHAENQIQNWPWKADGGAEGIRTPDLSRARAALSQLSYRPEARITPRRFAV